ncbi:Phage tail protein [compost metagenome]
MITVTADGVDLRSIGLGVKKHNIPPLPPTRDNGLELADRDGELDFGSSYGPRTFDLECVLMADNPTIDYHNRVAQVADLFNAKKGDISFTFSDRPGKRYIGRYAGTIAIEKIIFDGNLTIPIKMGENPFPLSDERLTELTITQSPQVLSVQSAGDERASPVIVLTNVGTATLAGFTIKNEYKTE